MIILAVAGLVFVGWLIGRRALRIMAVIALLLWVGSAVVEGYQDAMAEAEGGDVIQ